MLTLVLIVAVCFVGLTSPVVKRWLGNTAPPTSIAPAPSQAPTPVLVASAPPPSAPFKCDGRKYCTQMTSCAEAKQFLQRCPGTQMDGDNDGIPCESQWCN
ncbi:MAG: excalibur calcium-binding domain-containing protein [Pseudomonas sp.]